MTEYKPVTLCPTMYADGCRHGEFCGEGILGMVNKENLRNVDYRLAYSRTYWRDYYQKHKHD